MDLRNRLAALESVAGVNPEPFADPAYAVELERKILHGRLIPLPDLSAVNIDNDDRTRANLWN